MEPDNHLAAAPKPSLIVKLRYQPLCVQCADMLPKWCDPPQGEDPGLWKWTIDSLKQNSSTCHCCRFLVKTLEASPWIRYNNCDQLVVETRKVGSQHSSRRSDYSEFRTYYRPLLYVLTVDDFMEWSSLPEKFSLILPISQASAGTPGECNTQTFCGRHVNAMVDLSLIASWKKSCTSRHHGCFPQTYASVQDFRVIDVQKRCVVRANAKVEYAALSYVWGDAKRLTLGKDNEAWLSTPGALAQNEESVPKTFRDALEVAAALGIANLWVDALCIDQTSSEQVKHHMDEMNVIYGSSVLTIVATTDNADSGLPGISLPRGPPQAFFQHDGTRYLSSKPTFGTALQDSAWEKRAWCLQEKLFSPRLMVFTDTQAFYQCGAVTWFEDTIMEMEGSVHGVVQMREKTAFEMKAQKYSQYYTAYESHRNAFKDRSFWSLVQSYSRREMSYESDVIRAFGGILQSVEAQHGRAIWGIPQYHFLRGLSWYHQKPDMGSRRGGFPSWSWVGWRHSGADLNFANCKRKDTDIGVSNGRYRVARRKQDGRSVWDLSWYYHATDEYDSLVQPRTVQLEPQDQDAKPQGVLFAAVAASAPEPETSEEVEIRYKYLHEWGLPGHPGNMKPIHEPLPPLVRGPDMPHLSHILRFHTSVATVLVHPQDLDYRKRGDYRLLVPGSDIELARVRLDPLWSGIGKIHSLVYISRFCWEYDAYDEEDTDSPEHLHLLLIESVPKWGEVKRRVQLVQAVSILKWRKADPKWELVSLA